MVSFLINEKHPYHTERVCNDFNFIDRSPLVDEPPLINRVIFRC
jgi:hypothetical protein